MDVKLSVKEINNRPLVSVVMPAYNADKYISKAIESILNQTYSEFELIIVEDCSTDNTLREILKFSDNRIRLLKNDTNKGIAYSTNRAIRESGGRYIALMDDDDVASTDRLSLTVDFLEKNSDISIVGGGGIHIDEFGNCLGKFQIPRYNPMLINSILLFENCMINGTVLFRKEVVFQNNIWYREGCFGMQDFQFYMEASKVVKISNIPDVLLYYRRHSHNESDFQAKTNKAKRDLYYAKLQRDSLYKSGYRLEEEELQIINVMLAATLKSHYSEDEIKKLYYIFAKIIQQAKDMKQDGIEELRWLCRKLLCIRAQKSDIL